MARIPFSQSRPVVFPLLSAAALALLAALNWLGAPLITSAAPSGIIAFELAGAPQASGAILASWDAPARRTAALSLGLDYLFIVAYAGALGLACLRAATLLARHRWPLSGWGVWAAWGVWIAALLDALENAALGVILLGEQAVSPWPQIAAACAAVKFALIFVALVYVFYALAAALAARLAP